MCCLLVVLIASGCGLAGEQAATPALTPQPTPPALLPAPDPTPAAVETDAAAAATTETAETTDATAPPAAAETVVVDTISCLSTRVRVAQLLLPLATQPELAGATVFAADGELGGIGLLGEPGERLGADLEALQLSSFVPVLVASDEEGGGVQRLANLLGPIPSAAATAQSKTPEDVRKQWVEYGSRVKALGIDVVFGPVVDVGSGPGIESRSFSDDPAVVTTYARAVAEGLLEAGVLPVFKHFPGHGQATADSHLELPTTPALAELRTSDLVPYVDLLSDPRLGTASAVMIGHLSVPGLTDGVPTSLSPETVNGLLRQEIGFGGLVFTDAINMGAIVNTYGRLEALELSILAGADIVILGSLADLTPSLNHLVERVEADPAFAAIIDNRAQRVLAAKGQELICSGAQ